MMLQKRWYDAAGYPRAQNGKKLCIRVDFVVQDTAK